ncbi:MAG: hypothetical protein MUE46_17120 [Xanthomonadales bacterium]|jgi:hypothetical protein|nr:hypothetical protein [Xanthomonadales bacterium]
MRATRQPLSPWRWAWRAIWMGSLALGGGALSGGSLGLLSTTAGLIGAVLAGLLALPLAIWRLGSLGTLIWLLSTSFGIGFAYTLPQARAAQNLTVVDVADPAHWPADAQAIRVPDVRHQPALRGAASWTSTSGINSKKTQHYQVAVALAVDAESPVIGFHCYGGYGSPTPAGTVLVRLTDADHPCTRPLSEALAAVRAQGRTLAPGAETRLLALYADIAALRGSHGLTIWSRICVILYALYVLGVLLGARSGARDHAQ